MIRTWAVHNQVGSCLKVDDFICLTWNNCTLVHQPCTHKLFKKAQGSQVKLLHDRSKHVPRKLDGGRRCHPRASAETAKMILHDMISCIVAGNSTQAAGERFLHCKNQVVGGPLIRLTTVLTRAEDGAACGPRRAEGLHLEPDLCLFVFKFGRKGPCGFLKDICFRACYRI